MRFMIPGALREFAGGQREVHVPHPACALHEALGALWALHPGIRDRVITEQGQIRPHVNVFIGDENVRYTGGLASHVESEAVISIVPAVSGGLPLQADAERGDPDNAPMSRFYRGAERVAGAPGGRPGSTEGWPACLKACLPESSSCWTKKLESRGGRRGFLTCVQKITPLL